MKIISTIHQKGGVGKSTLTFNLANNLKDNAKICIIDVDFQGSIYESRSLSDMDTYHISEFEKVKELDYDFVFIDTPPYLFDGVQNIAEISDVIIIPIKPGIYDTLSINRTIGQLKEFKCDKKSLIVFNLVKPNTTITEEIRDQVAAFGVDISNNHISNLVAFARSPVTNSVEDNRTAQKQLDNLTKEILTKTVINS
ncbi:ParA family protein [Elizabethkingia anophelis]|uniref:ParA family protein n=1 Tax=Elizabethkingia anophelis TaxID=1117645 RepID=UPI0002AB9FB7|nr:ParA family protein [Elizabethkingia anophelis]ELR81100.1 conjugal transfer protein TraA [Elizabethkingia anophelis R26]MCS7369663.1 ParA family protein [Elizabethkingia anophelis]MCS7374980.1 ParA family protein [Elizabethkingia anophelis]MCS7387322.1 ParA family protein [Elizabethkingia anophelis]HAY3597912.1 ParA family protein [Elizabethkingia anophelis]